jgi:trehalose/maltose hydrolase-like predicted phosphorylase
VTKAAPADPWILACNDPRATEPALLWNGLIGIRLGRDGNAAPGDTLFMIDQYEKSGEEKIIPLPNPVGVQIDEGSRELNAPEAMKNYAQRLDMRTGVLTSEWDTDISTEAHPNSTAHVKVETVLHPSARQVGARWIVTCDRDADVAIGSGNPPEAKGVGGPWLEEHGDNKLGRYPIKWRERQRASGPMGRGENVKKGSPFVSDHVWTFGTGELSKPQAPDEPLTFDQIENASKAAWAKRWQTDIEIDGPVADQQAIRSFLFYLRSAIHPKGGMSISPFGLSNGQYNGHVFWDADIWVFPALALVDPEAAKSIPDYRLRHWGIGEFARWIERRPTGQGEMGPIGGKPAGSKYPWESSVSGRETVPGPSRFEDHITGSVSFALRQAADLGLADPVRTEQTLRFNNWFYNHRSVKGPRGLEIKGTMSPDENHVGDNDLYTNLLAEWLRRGGTWKGEGKTTYKLPKDGQTFLTYDDDALRGYKQAAAVLSIYPLQYPAAESQARAMMERFADKVIKNGPAMTDSVHAIIWARLGEKEKAYETWQKSWEPFTQNPLLLFSEKRTRSKTYFTTGAAGSLQSVLFGFLGFRIDWRKEPGAAWTTQLRGDAWLSIKPNLPRSWKSVKFRNFTILGRRYTLIASPSAARVTPGE